MEIDILIVDDVDANLISLEALLDSMNENYNVIKAKSGSEALEITLTQKVDLIILDIQMPDLDGFEVAKLLKSNKKTRDIPIIFLTAAFKSNEWVEKGFKLGAVDYLTKPIDENQFINRISLYTKLIKTIEENREKDKQLFESSKMASMGEMIGNIAHQWRQPLSTISTASSGIQIQKEYGYLTDDFLEEMLNRINDTTEYLSHTIDDFRDFIKGDTKKENFEIETYLEKAFIIEEGVLKNNDITVIKDIQKDLFVDNYSNLFLQIVINIINNAKDVVKNQKDDRLLFVTTKEINNTVAITFTDNGGGIDETILPKIFDAYFTTKHQSQGTGLGLYMTYNMCKTMQGKIEASNVEFEYEDKFYKGASFTITLPLS